MTIDHELSRAVVVYLYRNYVGPDGGREALATAFGAEKAVYLAAKIETMEQRCLVLGAPLKELKGTARLESVGAEFKREYPELSDEAIIALVARWNFNTR